MPDPNAADIRLLVLDVDGVLTDGGIHIDDRGVETKRFHVRDGAGVRMWRGLGHEVAIITGRTSGSLRHRAAEMGIELVYQGISDKESALLAVCEMIEIEPGEAAVIGDDLPDMTMLSVCGYPIAVGDACPEVREIAEFVTVRPGGHGAVREAIEHLLKSRGQWGEALAMYGVDS